MMAHDESHSESARDAALAELSGGYPPEEGCLECARERGDWREVISQLALAVPLPAPPDLRSCVLRAAAAARP